MSVTTDPIGAAQATASYLDHRRGQLLTLLEDPEMWRVLHRHALDVAHIHPAGSLPHLTISRLAQVAADIALLGEPS